MLLEKNTLTYIRDAYSGPWPYVVSAGLFIIIGGHLISYFFFGEKLLSVSVLAGNTLVAGSLIIGGIWLKKNYPGQGDT